jgi:hypothetical protein
MKHGDFHQQDHFEALERIVHVIGGRTMSLSMRRNATCGKCGRTQQDANVNDLAMFRQPVQRPFKELRQTFCENFHCKTCRALTYGKKDEIYSPNGMGFAVAIDRNQRGKKSRKVVTLPDVTGGSKRVGPTMRKEISKRVAQCQ